MATLQGTVTNKTIRLAPGLYEFHSNGKTYRLEEVGRSEGFPHILWQVSLMVDGCVQPPFDAGSTLREVKHWALVDSQE